MGKRRVGRPRLRWYGPVKKDVGELGGGSNWKKKASDRDGWKVRRLTG